MSKKLWGAAKAAHDKRLAKEARKRKRKSSSKSKSKNTSKGKPMAKKRKSSKSKGRRRRSGGSNLNLGLSQRDALIAIATTAGYGMLQRKAEEATGDDMKWFKEAGTITPLGRAGTYAALALGAWKLGRVKIAKPIGIGLAFAFALQLGRRGELYTDADTKAIMSGDDEGAMALGNGGDSVGFALLDENGEPIDYFEEAA